MAEKQDAGGKLMRQPCLFVLFTITAILLLMPGCGSSTDGGGRTVVMWYFAMGDDWISRTTEIRKKFNIKSQSEFVPQNAFLQKLEAAMRDGKGVPDIIEWMVESNKLKSDPSQCFAAPLEDYIKNSELMQKVPAGRLSWLTVGGHVYGLPHDVHPVVLIYNDTLWKEAGVDLAAIKTWDEFFEGAKKLTEKKENGKPLHYALPTQDSGLTDTMFMIWQQTGTQIFDGDGIPDFTCSCGKFKAFIEKWIKWKDSGAICAWDWGNFAANLKSGTLCSYVSPDWWVGQMTDAARDGKYQWRVRALPEYTGGNGTHTASWGGSFLAIPRTAKDKDFIFNMIAYMQYGNKELAVMRYKTGGMVAPVPDAWDDPVFHQPDDRFGGQKLGELQVTLAKEMPSVNNSEFFWDALTDFGQQYTEMIGKKETVDEGLRKIQDAVLKRMLEKPNQ
jgi:arabinosaccharide transport system substrate-binding protein